MLNAAPRYRRDDSARLWIRGDSCFYRFAEQYFVRVSCHNRRRRRRLRTRTQVPNVAQEPKFPSLLKNPSSQRSPRTQVPNVASEPNVAQESKFPT